MKKLRILRGCFAAVLLGPCTAFGITYTWDGGAGNNAIVNGLNYVGDPATVVSDLVNTDLIFTGSVRTSPNVSGPFSTDSVTFDSSADAFTIGSIGGHVLSIGATGIINSDAQTMTFSVELDFSGVINSAITASAGDLTFTNTITLPTGTLSVNGANDTTFADFSGVSGLTKSNTGIMRWSPTVMTEFVLTISGGKLSTQADGTTDVFANLSEIHISGSGIFEANENVTLDATEVSLTGGTSQFNVLGGKTLRIQNGTDLDVTSATANLTTSSLVVTDAGSTLTTTSGLTLANGGTFDILSGADVSVGTLLGVGSFGNGTVTVDGSGTSLSAGTITRVGASGNDGTLTYRNSSTGSTAKIEVNPGGSASTDGLLQVQSGALVTGGNMTINDGNGGSGTVTINGAGTALTLTGASTVTMGATSAGTATLNVQSSGTFNSGSGLATVNKTGTIALAGGIYTSHGDLTLNGGQLTRDATGVFGLDASRTFTVQAGGDAAFTGPYTDSTASDIVVTGAGSTLTSTQGIGIEAGAALSVTNGGAVSGTGFNIGTSGGDGSSVLVDGTGSSLTSNFTNVAVGGNTGSLAFTNGSTGAVGGLTMSTSNTASSDGSFNIESGSTVTATTLFVSQLPAANIGTVTITGVGSKLTLTGVNTSVIGAGSASSGMLVVESGATLTTGTSGITINNTGELDILPGGTLNGPADFSGNGPLNIAGNYSPGAVSGANQTTDVSFAQNMTFYSTTNITLEIGGVTPGTQHDQLIFNGAGTPHVTFAGTVNLVLINGFVPQVGQTFNLLEFDAARDAGAISSVNYPALPAGLFWRNDEFFTTGVMRVSNVPMTFAQWQSAYGVGASTADNDNDGIKNGIEFLLGTNPATGFSGAPMTELAPVRAANTTASVSFKIPADPASDARYRVRASADLLSWTTIASKDGGGAWSGTAAVTTGAVVAGYTNITVAETLPLTTARRFHRLEVGP